jgi:acetyl-CoA acetyltransferase
VTGARIAVAGIGESASGRVPDRSAAELHWDAAAAALQDAGLRPSDVDGLFSCGSPAGMHVVSIAEHLGLRPRCVDSTQVGGASWEVFVEHAVAALRDRRCDVALLAYGSTSRSDLKRGLRGADVAFRPSGLLQYEAPYGLTIIGRYALAARRHMHVYGTTPAQLAAVAQAASDWAQRNPQAFRFGSPVTVDDVLASELVCDPLHALDCCLRTDGGGAVVLVREDRARDLPRPPVWVLGAASCVSHTTMAGMGDLASLPGGPDVASRAFGEAGVAPADVDVVQTYDSYTITVLLALEAMGFCKPGESGELASSGALAPGGALPTNTDGGGLASSHPGMRGVFLLVEAVRRLRDDAQVAACFGVGGFLSSCGMVVLGR